MKNKLLSFVKNEAVLSISAVLAVISCFFTKPDAQYIDYIDFRTLSLLFCLMLIMAGFQKIGVFKVIAEKLLRRIKSVKLLVLIFTMLCFFAGMIITNDVALITFVPFTFACLKLIGGGLKNKLAVPVVVMQTIAANLGSMLTPIGNPQNLYLHGISDYSVGEFIVLMLPYTCLSFALLVAWALLLREKENIEINFGEISCLTEKNKIVIYVILFALCLLAVARIADYRIVLIVTAAAVLVFDRKTFAYADYYLLATFIALFVFIGNIGKITWFNQYISKIISGHECIIGVLSSQIISNVPAALLLSGFTDNLKDLIVGVNLGGLGTLIASMASLISFKYVVKEDKGLTGKYLIEFTAANILFLIALLGLYAAVA